MDADGTYPIQELPSLYALYRNGYDMVVGARTGAHYQEGLIKAPLRVLLRLIVEWTAGRTIPDINSGLRVFSRDLVIQHLDRLCNTFSFTTSLTLALMMNARFVAYKEVPYYRRIGTTRVHLFRDSLRTLQFIVEAAVFYNPLKIFLLFSMFSLGCAAISLIVGLVTERASFFMLGVGAILLAILDLSLGLMCVLLKQIMDSSDPTAEHLRAFSIARRGQKLFAAKGTANRGIAVPPASKQVAATSTPQTDNYDLQAE
jgi:hypothetical protein